MIIRKVDNALVDRVREPLRMQTFKPALLPDIVELGQLAETRLHPPVLCGEISQPGEQRPFGSRRIDPAKIVSLYAETP